MSKYPLFPNEIILDDINFSNINYSNNKEYFCISYGETNQTLYLQSPLFKFIQPITREQKNNLFNDLYLFLTPQDSNTFSFIDLINNLESKMLLIAEQFNSNISSTSNIKSYELDEENNNTNQIKQVVKYLKIKLLDITQLEYNNNSITIDQLNDLIEIVNLKLIFEISMAWITKTKVGLYLKPIKVKAIDIPKITKVEFRDDNDNSDIQHMEQTENIAQIINSQTIASLSDSAFKIKNTEICNMDSLAILNTFIPSQGYNNIQMQLKNELNEINKVYTAPKIKSPLNTNHKTTPKTYPKTNPKTTPKTKKDLHELETYHSQYTLTQYDEDDEDNDNSTTNIKKCGRKKKYVKKIDSKISNLSASSSSSLSINDNDDDIKIMKTSDTNINNIYYKSSDNNSS